MQRSNRKLATWLFLIAYLLTGFAAGQRLVLCLEPDGTVAIEALEADSCAPCGDSDESFSDRIGADFCACIDIPIPAQSDDPQLKHKRSAEKSDSIAAAPISYSPLAAPLSNHALARSASFASGPPRQKQDIELIRTVVLRV